MPKGDESGIVEPQFTRGFDPAQHKWKRPSKRSPWQRHFELGRLHPTQWMKVAEAKKGGCKERLRIINNDRSRIHQYLDKNHPLERWQIKTVTLDGTWCDRELYLRFLGELSPEEDAADRARRAVEYQARLAVINQRRAERAQAARDKAREEEASAKVAIRARPRRAR